MAFISFFGGGLMNCKTGERFNIYTKEGQEKFSKSVRELRTKIDGLLKELQEKDEGNDKNGKG